MMLEKTDNSESQDEAEYYSDEEMEELFYDLWEAGIIGIGNLMYKIAED